MKKILLLLTLLYAKSLLSQSLDPLIIKQANDSAIKTKTRLNFAVPDIPAFKALGTDPSTILRPSSPKDLALMFSNFANSDASFIIPKNFSAEITPGLIFKPWYTLEAYRKKAGLRILTKTSLSIGANSDQETKVNSVAIGIRTTLIDKGDFRADENFLKDSIFTSLDALTAEIRKRQTAYLKGRGMSNLDFAKLPGDERKLIQDTLFTGLLADSDKLIDDKVSQYKKTNWNASRMDFAYALLLQSPDSLLGNVKPDKHVFWLTYAIKPGRHNKWGQLLLGVNNTLFKYDTKYYNSFNGNFRFYAGANRLKGFIEAQYTNTDSPVSPRIETLYAQIGVEAGVFNGIWVHFGTGILNGLQGNAKSQLMSNVNLYFTFPENLKLF